MTPVHELDPWISTTVHSLWTWTDGEKLCPEETEFYTGLGLWIMLCRQIFVLPWWLSGKKKSHPVMLETWVCSLGCEDPLEEGRATHSSIPLFFLVLFLFIYFSWRLITLQYCRGFCHTLIWITHGFACVSHPEPPSHLSPLPIPLGHPSAPALSTCIMHRTWTGDLFHIQ